MVYTVKGLNKELDRLAKKYGDIAIKELIKIQRGEKNGSENR